MKKIILILLIFLVVCCQEKTHSVSKESVRVECRDFIAVDFDEIISQPMIYHEKKVLVTGYYEMDFERSALCKAVYNKSDALWIGFDKKSDFYSNPETINERTVSIIGMFDAKRKGHLGKYKGHLEAICILNN